MRDLKILLIEDDQIETLKFERILNTFSQKHEQQNASNGEMAIELLNNQKELPNIIFLDLNMPKMNGLEFLNILKNDERLYHIPVVVLTTSNNYNDIIESYREGIAGYIMKPLKYDAYKSQLKIIIDYWSINQFAEL